MCNQLTPLEPYEGKKAVQPFCDNYVLSLCRVNDGSVEIQMPLTQIDLQAVVHRGYC